MSLHVRVLCSCVLCVPVCSWKTFLTFSQIPNQTHGCCFHSTVKTSFRPEEWLSVRNIVPVLSLWIWMSKWTGRPKWSVWVVNLMWNHVSVLGTSYCLCTDLSMELCMHDCVRGCGCVCLCVCTLARTTGSPNTTKCGLICWFSDG